MAEPVIPPDSERYTAPESVAAGRARDRRLEAAAIVAAIVVGAALRTWQYAVRSSLWLDEAALARNIVDRSYRELAGPLDYGQVAPVGFLWLERAAVSLWGPGELSLRLVPFLSSILALPLFAVLATRILPTPAAILASWLFALAVPLIFYGATLKPYAVDVLASVLILMTVVSASRQQLSWSWFTAAGVGLLGVLAWVSATATLTLAAVGLVMLGAWVVRREYDWRHLLLIAGFWIALAAPPALLALHSVSPESGAYFDRRWASAFMPAQPRLALHWAWTTAVDLFSPAQWALDGSLSYGVPAFFIAALGLGMWSLARRQPLAFLYLSAPVVVALAASAWRIYPFTGRFVIFLIPALLLTIASSVSTIRSLTGSRVASVALAGVLTSLAVRAVVRTPPPQRHEDLRPVLERLAQERSKEDRIFVYYGAGQTFLFYAPLLGFLPDTYLISRCGRGHPEYLIEDLETLRDARRVWLVLSHTARSSAETSLLLRHLETTGVHRQHVTPPSASDAEAYLFERIHSNHPDMRMPEVEASRNEEWECGGPADPRSKR